MRDAVSPEQFEEFLKEKLGEAFERARLVFDSYGPNTSLDVTNVIMHAVDKGKVDEVLTELEKHYNERISFQHPRIKGLVRDNLCGVNPTEAMFLRICTVILGLSPT